MKLSLMSGILGNYCINITKFRPLPTDLIVVCIDNSFEYNYSGRAVNLLSYVTVTCKGLGTDYCRIKTKSSKCIGRATMVFGNSVGMSGIIWQHSTAKTYYQELLLHILARSNLAKSYLNVL